jgi:hypothetical protein
MAAGTRLVTVMVYDNITDVIVQQDVIMAILL